MTKQKIDLNKILSMLWQNVTLGEQLFHFYLQIKINKAIWLTIFCMKFAAKLQIRAKPSNARQKFISTIILKVFKPFG